VIFILTAIIKENLNVLTLQLGELYGNLEQIIVEDWPIWIKIIKSELKFTYTLERLVKYRVHTRQTTSQTNIDTFKINYYEKRIYSNSRLDNCKVSPLRSVQIGILYRLPALYRSIKFSFGVLVRTVLGRF
jgi:hypothetical protein